MDPGQGISASEWLNTVPEAELVKVLFEYGEEKHARKIARAIKRQSLLAPIDTTRKLADLVESVSPRRGERKHPATRTFQAIRIAINNELGELNRFLETVPAILAPFGRLAVISFHSLEDRRVKRFMREQSRVDVDLPPGIPIVSDTLAPVMRLIGKAIKASPEEVDMNPRSRSAVLRVAEKLG
jgi:16S rRNA (cytosine1402-N4)-methyltransferase